MTETESRTRPTDTASAVPAAAWLNLAPATVGIALDFCASASAAARCSRWSRS
jgi:hypothetical protein